MFGQRFLLCTAAVLATLTATSTTGVDAQHLRRLGGALTLDKGMFDAMLAKVNKERTANGLKPLCYNKNLKAASQGHSQDQADHNKMSHTGSGGSSMSDRIKQAGYHGGALAENVAAGQTTVDSVMESWMNSDGHRQNILGKDYTQFGMGYAYTEQDGYHHFWTQNFGKGETGDDCEGESGGDADKPTPAPTGKPTSAPPTGKPTPPEPKPTPAPTPAPSTTAPVTQSPTPAPTPAPTTKKPGKKCEAQK